mmetsp:Transcript_35959/g.78452  ORF Transcript_35959/g.78452 Transcript_35959/m.78452 type:complete len:207 (+) Transcript_35959:150-770(+)|eukprot:CAMPEP_0118929292 /NCGR_PEP_ID=MMETSP1169-20130426/6334_1 /TAXON_ID=36882 /ORGANISM="Pyramimonas obovata, Strain CCMP722" /LENGTH=206 /DNA_ID=CAMNT_0006871451 /DNA_START=150 /DNA_END=770 /DNA_ORIENTATION=-
MSEPETDVFRDTPIRYLGYANEFGESFKSFISTATYRGTYAIATAYGISDALDKGYKAKLACDEFDARVRANASSGTECSSASGNAVPKADHSKHVAFAVADTFVWQMLASVMIPGFIINRAVAATQWTLDSCGPQAAAPSQGALPGAAQRGFLALTRNPSLRRWAPTAVGLSLIPVIIHPIDSSVTWGMDMYVRPYYLAELKADH